MPDKPKPTLIVDAALAQTETKQIQPTPIAAPPDPVFIGGSFAIGGAVIWAAVGKLIEKYGSSAIESRQQKLGQELAKERNISEFYLKEADRDSKTINDMLMTLLTGHLSNTTQLHDLYYELLKKYELLANEMEEKNNHIATMESTLKDILSVLNMAERKKG